MTKEQYEKAQILYSHIHFVTYYIEQIEAILKYCDEDNKEFTLSCADSNVTKVSKELVKPLLTQMLMSYQSEVKKYQEELEQL